MQSLRNWYLAGLLLLISVGEVHAQSSRADRSVQDRVISFSRPVRKELLNVWPAELEAAFRRRARRVMVAQARDIRAGLNTYFENEKRSYGFLMAHVLVGDSETALKYLQAEDHQHQEWHRETAGIDYYACFTLKHQVRKYFYFGDRLNPEYRNRMLEGARLWTEKDPLRRPHYAHVPGQQGWGPNARDSWVDVRSTENLWLMRTSSVYLMAEEAGNEETRQQYRQAILDYTRTLYRIGIGEWDSENYHGHSVTPLLNLYDFAEDAEVQAAAKACLDFLAIAGAVKYWRGGFNGPTKRDYNHAQPFGGSAANSLWMWFGDHPVGKTKDWESDEVHQVTSAYRPPLAAVHLAVKKFPRPMELFAAKPGYEATTQFRDESHPEYFETQYFGHSYQMGSLTAGTSVDGGDVNGFKMLVFDREDGAIALHAVPGTDPSMPGSPMYKTGVVPYVNRVAQQENLILWLAGSGEAPWMWVIPKSVNVFRKGGITFLKSDRTWIAVRSLNASEVSPDDMKTMQLAENKKSRFPDHQVLSAVGLGGAYCGLAIEVGEKESHGTFEKFVEAVLSAEADLTDLQDGVARYRSTDGKWLGIHWNDDAMDLGVWRNGERQDLANAALYDSPILNAAWRAGQLELKTPGAEYRCRVESDGTVRFN